MLELPYSDEEEDIEDESSSRQKLPKKTVDEAWQLQVGKWVAMKRTACPSKPEKEELMHNASMSFKQVRIWFNRFRQKLLKKMVEEAQKLMTLQCQ